MTAQSKDKVNVYADPAVVANMVDRYTSADTDEAREAVVEALAAELDRSVVSIRSKLAAEKVYVAKTYKTKTGTRPETKESMVMRLEKNLNVPAGTLDSLEKVTKRVLRILLNEDENFKR